MKIKSVSIKNFRTYKDEVKIAFNNLTTFVGPNDIGKSTILEALDIFFNDGKGVIQIDKNDVNKEALANGDTETIISVEFTELPDSIVLDEAPVTTLQEEYLLSNDKTLIVQKNYDNAGKAKVYIKANHPQNPSCSDLLIKKIGDLKKILVDNSIGCNDRSEKVCIRKAIWNHFSQDLQLGERLIETSGDGMKDIWVKLQNYLPVYTLFQSDRSNSDKDKEAQDPIKSAVKNYLSRPEMKSMLDDIAANVLTYIGNITNSTLNKLQKLNPNLATQLNPVIPSQDSLKWGDVFKAVGINGDNDIPMNKRGSGVKRLLLLSFFQAEAERLLNESQHQDIIYAIEEPETSQHFNHQVLLIKALKDMASAPDTHAQIVLTTHSASMVKMINLTDLRLIVKRGGTTYVESVTPQLLPYSSLNEINYSAFGLISEEYHNELYGYLQEKATMEDSSNESQNRFDNWLYNHRCPKNKQWIRDRQGQRQPPTPVTLQTYIRNLIHHPENTHNNAYNDMELNESIKKMREIVESL